MRAEVSLRFAQFSMPDMPRCADWIHHTKVSQLPVQGEVLPRISKNMSTSRHRLQAMLLKCPIRLRFSL